MSNRPATVVRDDVPLVEKTAAGDANALRALYDKHASRVMIPTGKGSIICTVSVLTPIAATSVLLITCLNWSAFSTVPTANSGPTGIVVGRDGALWFTEFDGNKIGVLTP